MTPEDKLQKLIIEYKRYNANRTKYYASKLRELGELQSLVQELEDSNGIDNLPNLIKTLKEQNASLRKTINTLRKELDSVRLLFTPEILHIYHNLSEKDLKSLIKIKEQQTIIKNLEAKVAHIKRLADEYLCKLIKLQSNHDS